MRKTEYKLEETWNKSGVWDRTLQHHAVCMWVWKLGV